MNEIPISKLLWIDLEMTGLDPQKDVITEVAVIITDLDFKEIASYQSGVKHAGSKVEELLNASPFWQAAVPQARQEMLDLSANGNTEDEVQAELLALINQHFDDNPVILAGNSIHQDRRFIRQHWAKLEGRLHYRMLDVSAWKIVMNNKYQVVYDKNNVHRAMDDIRESIAELKLYLGHVA